MSEQLANDVDVAAAEQILATWRRQRDITQHNLARKGDLDGPLLLQIEEQDKQILIWEAEVKRRASNAVIDKWSLAEAKYRDLLATTWGTERGLPTVVGLERLERVRIELAIERERAQELERDVRALLAREAFNSIDRYHLLNFHVDMHKLKETGGIKRLDDVTHASSIALLQQIGKVIRLDVSIAQELFLAFIPKPKANSVWYRFDDAAFGTELLKANNLWRDHEEQALFQKFLDILPKRAAQP